MTGWFAAGDPEWWGEDTPLDKVLGLLGRVKPDPDFKSRTKDERAFAAFAINIVETVKPRLDKAERQRLDRALQEALYGPEWWLR